MTGDLSGFFARMLDARDASVDLHDVAGLGVLGAHVGLSGWHVLALHQPFDGQAFGAGAAAIVAALGAAGFFKGHQRKAEAAADAGAGAGASAGASAGAGGAAP